MELNFLIHPRGCGTRHAQLMRTNAPFKCFWETLTSATFRFGATLSLFFTLCLPLISVGQTTDTTHVTLRFVTMKADNRIVWDKAIARFEQAHPHITIAREIAPHSSTAYHDLW